MVVGEGAGPVALDVDVSGWMEVLGLLRRALLAGGEVYGR